MVLLVVALVAFTASIASTTEVSRAAGDAADGTCRQGMDADVPPRSAAALLQHARGGLPLRLPTMKLFTRLNDGPGTAASGAPQPPLASSVALDETGYQAIVATGDRNQMYTYIQRLAAQLGLRVVDEQGVRAVADSQISGPNSFNSLVAEISEAAKLQLDSAGYQQLASGESSSASAGLTTSLDEAGYQTVLGLGSDVQMAVYIQRLVQSMGIPLPDDALMLAQRSKSIHSLAELREQLANSAQTKIARDAQVVLTASLDEVGYRQVVQIGSDVAMEQYIQKLADAIGIEINLNGAVSGMAPYFSGSKQVQSFTALQDYLIRDRELLYKTVGEVGPGAVATPVTAAAAISPPGPGDPPVPGSVATLAPAPLGSSGEPHQVPVPRPSPPDPVVHDRELVKKSGGVASAGATASLDETGYEQVAALRSNAEMEAYIHRVAKSLGVNINLFGAVSGMAPYFSGVQQTQSFAALAHMLVRDKVLLTKNEAEAQVALTAPLDEAGYEQVAQLRSDPEMELFILRVASSMGIEISLSGAVSGMAPFFSGSQQVQSFAALVGHLTQNRELFAQNADEVSIGTTAPLDESGYQLVADLSNNAEMEAYIRRVASSLGVTINLFGAVSGLAPYFSGAQQVQSFGALVETLLKDRFLLAKSDAEVQTSLRASLDEVGYQEVAQLRNDSEMEVFIHRLARSMGIDINLKGAITGMAPYFSGTQQDQSFAELQDYLVSNKDHLTEGAIEMPMGAGADLAAELRPATSELRSKTSGLRSVAELRNKTPESRPIAVESRNKTTDLRPTVVALRNKTSGSQNKSHHMSAARSNESHQSHPGRLLVLSPQKHDVELLRRSSVFQSPPLAVAPPGLALYSSLDEAGYQQVALLHNDTEMEIYIQRVAASLGIEINLSGAISGMAPYFSGSKQLQTFTALVEYLVHDREFLTRRLDEVSVAVTAPLDESGYKQVADLRNDVEMEAYIRRAARSLGVTINLFGAVSRMAPYFSGTMEVRSYAALTDMLLKDSFLLAKTDAEVQVAVYAQLDESGYQQVAQLRSDSEMEAFIHRLARSMGIDINLKGAISGMAPYFSGTKQDQSFPALQDYLASNRALLADGANEVPAGGTPGRADTQYLAASASLDEAGYQEVARLQNDTAMEGFIQRAARAVGVEIQLAGALSGMASSFSGSKQLQSFAALQDYLIRHKEVLTKPASEPSVGGTATGNSSGSLRVDVSSLRNSELVASHRSGSQAWVANAASLDEVGYRKVMNLHSDTEIEAFIKRVAKKLKVPINLPGALSTMATDLLGPSKDQSFADLQDYLVRNKIELAASATDSMASNVSKDSQPNLVPATVHSQEASAPRAGNQSLSATAPLDEEGYLQVAKLRSDRDMEVYIGRAARELGVAINSSSALTSIAPYYSGVKQQQTFAALRELLSQDREVFSGNGGQFSPAMVVPLNESGYKQVVTLGDTSGMETFIRRVARNRGIMIRLSGAVSGMAPYYSGAKQVQSLSAMVDYLTREKELLAKTDSEANAPVNGSNARLDEVGYWQTALLRSRKEMEAFIRRAAHSRNISINSPKVVRGMAKFYSGIRQVRSFGSLVSHLKKERALLSRSNTSLGWTAALDGTGFEKVFQHHNAEDMQLFMLRLAESRNIEIRSPGVLRKMANKYNTTQHTFEALVEDLVDHGIVTTNVSGSNASLDESGYEQVVQLTNNSEMAAYICRLASHRGLPDVAPADLAILAGSHSGEDAALGFANLVEGLASRGSNTSSNGSSRLAELRIGTNASSNRSHNATVSSSKLNASLNPSVRASEFSSTPVTAHSFASSPTRANRSNATRSNSSRNSSLWSAESTTKPALVTQARIIRRTQPLVSSGSETSEASMSGPPAAASSGENQTNASLGSALLSGHGGKASLDEEGFSQVVSMRSMTEMEMYIRRVAKTRGLDLVSIGQASLAGLANKFANEAAPKLSTLVDELMRSRAGTKSAVTGGNAVLNEVGYMQVARLHSDGEMEAFIHRVAQHMGIDVRVDGAIAGMAPYYSGSKAVQSYTVLEHDLTRQRQLLSGGSSRAPTAALLEKPGSHIVRPVASLSEELPEDNASKPEDDASKPEEPQVEAEQDPLRAETDSMSLDEAGYIRIVLMHSSEEMERFIRRVADNLQIQITDDDGLAGIVPFYSGEKSIQSYDLLKRELEANAQLGNWCVPAVPAIPTDAGDSGGAVPVVQEIPADAGDSSGAVPAVQEIPADAGDSSGAAV